MAKHSFFRVSVFAALLVAGNFWSCTGNQKPEQTKAAGEKLTIVTTTGIIADAVKNLAGTKAEVISIMGPGVDPHLYKATQGDLEKLTSADLIVYNGLHLEGKMGDVLEKLGRQKKVVAIADFIPKDQLRSSPDFPGSYDPHIWFDVQLWKQATLGLQTSLNQAMPSDSAYFTSNARQWTAELDSLHNWSKIQIGLIPAEHRSLITAHDAFGYFGRAYGIDVRGLQGISTLSEYGLKDVSDLVNFIAGNKIKAVFVESSVPRKAIDAVVTGCQSKGHQVAIGGTLYSDALGPGNSPEGTYQGMVRHNVSTITNALR